MSRPLWNWPEKYRPSTVGECILPKPLKQTFQSFVDAGEIPNVLLVGPPGCGKTSVALAAIKEIDAEAYVVNGSLNGDIDTLRNEITAFASTTSLFGGRKYVVFDEADYLTYKTQPALRTFMEEYAGNCGFILTANYASKIIPAVQSRCPPIDFSVTKDDAPGLMLQFFVSLKSILDKENITYEKQALVSLIGKYFPDYRRIINLLQIYSMKFGAIDGGILTPTEEENFDDLIHLLKAKHITDTRKWLAENLSNDPNILFRLFYDKAKDHFDISFIPAVIEALAEYQDKATRVADQEINMAAFLLNVMINAVWKGKL